MSDSVPAELESAPVAAQVEYAVTHARARAVPGILLSGAAAAVAEPMTE
jgi:hypothetical protein